MNDVTKDECYFFLDLLRESGEVNMFGAPRYLQDNFGISKNEAIKVTTEWMETFKERSKDEIK